MKLRNIHLIYLFALLFVVGCGRKTSNQAEEISEPEISIGISKDTTLITAEEPFKNQPNELCTIIRPLDISYYAPSTVTDDVTKFPVKYCLLDICLETVDPGAMTIDIGEDGETVTTTFQLIKIFESESDAKAYAEKFQIKDVKWSL